MQLITFSRSHFPLWIRASLLVGVIALSACSTSKPAPSASTPQSGAANNSGATKAPAKCWLGLIDCAPARAKKQNNQPSSGTSASADTAVKDKPASRKCWFGLFNCATEPAVNALPPAPAAQQTVAAAPAKAASTTAPASKTDTAAPATSKCWLGLFTCSTSTAVEKKETVARPAIVTVTATGEATEKTSTQKTIESVITASAANTAASPSAAAPSTSPAQATLAPVASKSQLATPSTARTLAVPTAAAPVAPADVSTPPQKRWLGIFRPYKMDIQQGNFVSQEAASKLREGMSKEQVRFLLGAPLLTDMFHAERWDYVFRLQKGNGMLTTTRLTVFFKDNRVARFESTALPNEAEYLNHISGSEAKKKAPADSKPQDKAQDKPVPPTSSNNS